MKNYLYCLSVLLIFLGSELIPDALDPPPNELARKNYLQKGDTLHIPIESLINENSQNGMLAIKELGDTNVVSIVHNELVLSVVGKDFGSTTIVAEVSGLEHNQIIYLNFIVLEGFPVFVRVGEESLLLPVDFFDLDGEGIEPDSIFLSSSEEIYSFSWRNEFNQSVVVTGMRPGTQKVLFSVIDDTDAHEAYLIIETSVRQVVVGEVFTNVGCIPCVPVNHILDEIVEQQNANMTMIRYHWNSPLPIDPMYDYNPDDVELRRIMYSVPFCPVVVINGVHVLNGQGPVENNAHGDVLIENAVNNELYIGHTYALDGDSITVDIEIRPFLTINDAVKVWAVVVEDSIEYEGFNGELIHMQVMRDLDFGNEWEALEENEIYTSQISLLKPESYSVENPFFHVITMVQSMEDNRIYQSNRWHLPL